MDHTSELVPRATRDQPAGTPADERFTSLPIE